MIAMTRIVLGCAVLAAMTWCGLVRAAEGNGRSPFESSVVTIEVTFKDYDYFQPWTKPTRSIRKHALVVGERELVTTAQNLADRTLVRVQKRGRGRWYNAEVRWVDYHANLGVLSVADEAFWNGLNAVEMSGTVPRRNDYEILRWRDGNLEMRRADFSKFTVSEGSMSFAPRIQLELNTEIGGLGWAEPVLADGKVIGLTVSKGGNVCTVMPTPFMVRVLEAKKAGKYPGLGYFDFVWQAGQNPATLEFLRVPGEPRGAVVIEVPKHAGDTYAVKTRDVLLEIDGFPIDMEGDYEDPDFGHLMLEGLATRGHFSGDKVRMKILREGKEMEVQYELPKADFSVDLLPMFVFDKEPEYLVAGGLIFQPLHQQYLRGWGDDWRRRAPFRLVYATSEGPTKDRSSLVILSQVLPDPINIGYQEVRNVVLETVNGKTVRSLKDLQEAMKSPQDGVHVIEFFKGENLRRLLLDATELEPATARVLRRYGIPAAAALN